jgi:hypothetical protein
MLPARYVAAFEQDAPLLVFSTLSDAERFLAEFARYLELDVPSVLAAFRAQHLPLAARLDRLGPRHPAPARSRRRAPAAVRARPTPARRVRAAGAIGPRARPRLRPAMVVFVLVLISVIALAFQVGSDAEPGSETGDRRVEERDDAGASPAAAGTAPSTPASTPASPGPSLAAATGPQLPGGGYAIFPFHRVLAYYGWPKSEELGVLGTGTPDEIARAIRQRALAYAGDGLRPILPAYQLIATVATSASGDDGMYRARLEPELVRTYVEAARSEGLLLVLDIQPGRSDFLTEVRAYEEFLAEPHVGVALDPEWHVGPAQRPGDVVGTVDAAEINEVAEYLAEICRREGLPQKLLVVHQFNFDMITNRDDIATPPELAVVIDIDGVGPRSIKLPKYDALTAGIDRFYVGVKLYTNSETDILQPDEVLELTPRPDLVIYQ